MIPWARLRATTASPSVVRACQQSQAACCCAHPSAGLCPHVWLLRYILFYEARVRRLGGERAVQSGVVQCTVLFKIVVGRTRGVKHAW